MGDKLNREEYFPSGAAAFNYNNVKFYVSLEHTKVLYNNPKYVEVDVMSSGRFYRNNLIHYANFNVTTKFVANETLHIDLVLHDFVTNKYIPTWLEYHGSVCKVVETFPVKPFLERANTNMYRRCPFAPGHYYIVNATFPFAAVPAGMPITSARIYITFTLPENLVVLKTTLGVQLKPINKQNRDKIKTTTYQPVHDLQR